MSMREHPVIKQAAAYLKSLDKNGIFNEYDSTMVLLVAALVIVTLACVVFAIWQALQHNENKRLNEAERLKADLKPEDKAAQGFISTPQGKRSTRQRKQRTRKDD